MMAKTLILLSLVVVLPLIVTSWLWAQMLDYYSIPVKYYGPSHPNSNSPPFPGATAENLWWFVHISDIHVSRFRDPSRTTDFQRFCQENIDVIHPEIVLVTGDLTDAKTQDYIGSTQYEIEWKSYRSAIKLARADEKAVWIDIRGNHAFFLSHQDYPWLRGKETLVQYYSRSDGAKGGVRGYKDSRHGRRECVCCDETDAFDVPHVSHEKNYYRKYSIYGPDGDYGSFIYEHKLPFGTYSFVSVYALLDPGPKRPFNFFGILSEDELKKVETNVAKTVNSNHTILFGHYPTSTVVTPKPGLTDVLGKVTAYLCGHLHSLGGVLPNLKALQRTGSLELEVEDWKDNRMYRVMAMDHDLLSFTDVKLGQWPIILITNPKRARFMAPKHEPVNKMLHSTHIRFLLFSPFEITSTSVYLDGIHQGAAVHVEGPLYVLPWDPQQYKSGLHYIAISASDSDSNSETVKYRFSVDGSRPEQWLVPAVLLMSNMTQLLLFLYAILFCALVLPLPIIRFSFRKGSDVLTANGILRGLILLAHTDICYYTMILLALYPLIGPWCVGDLIGGYYGVSTMHGIYVNGSFVGEVFTYAVVLLDMLLLHLPLTIFFVIKLSLRGNPPAQNGCVGSKHEHQKDSTSVLSLCLFCLHCLAYTVLAFPFIWMYYVLKNLWYAYGPMAFFVSPKSLWSYFLLVYAIYKVHIPNPPEVIANGSHGNHAS